MMERCTFQFLIGAVISTYKEKGKENCLFFLKLSQVWQCGGSMEVLPCSRVAHIERTKKPYNNDIDYYAKRNALRAAEVWMDDFKSHVYMAWNIPMAVSMGHTSPEQRQKSE